MTSGPSCDPSNDLPYSRLERWLIEYHLPFWLPRLQPDDQGYQLDLDHRGDPIPGKRTSRAVPQCRSLWFCSRLSQSPYSSQASQDLAQAGFDWLQKHLWDPLYGGVFWDPGQYQQEKHLYAQAFALFALCEFAAFSGEAGALDLADQLYAKVEQCRDPLHPGYLESLNRDWTPITTQGTSILGALHHEKTINTHLHLLEALTSYQRLTGRATLALEALLTQLDAWTGGDRFSREGLRLDRRSHFGHQLEYIWLRATALQSLGRPPVDSTSEAFFERCQAGWDRCRGGYFEELWRPWHLWRGKIWWVQAEALLATLLLARHGNSLARLRLPRLMHWIEEHQIDSRYLDWHAHSSRPLGHKAGPWKTPYHVGRCLLEGLSLREWDIGRVKV